MTSDADRARDAAVRVVAVCDTLADLTPADLDEFVADLRSQWAVEMGLIRVGEGVNRISPDVLARFDGQPWRQIVAMRHLAAHQYDDLDPRRVWRTVTLDVPALRDYLADVLVPGLDGRAESLRLYSPGGPARPLPQREEVAQPVVDLLHGVVADDAENLAEA